MGARLWGGRYLVTTSVAETVLALMLGRSVKVLAVSVLALDLLVLIEESLLSVGVAEIAGTGRVTRDEARATRARGGGGRRGGGGGDDWGCIGGIMIGFDIAGARSMMSSMT